MSDVLPCQAKLTPRQEILLKEYAESGQQARSIQNTINLSLTIVTGVSAFAVHWSNSQLHQILAHIALLFAAAACIIFAIIINRSRIYYDSYMKRIRSIENTLGMKLYTCGYNVTVGTKINISSQKLIVSSIFIISIFLLIIGCLRIMGMPNFASDYIGPRTYCDFIWAAITSL